MFGKLIASNGIHRFLIILKKSYKSSKLQKKRVSYSGNTSAFQAEARGSIPLTRSLFILCKKDTDEKECSCYRDDNGSKIELIARGNKKSDNG